MNSLPSHIAVIMDGNGRWAAKRHLPRIAGHRAGVESVRRVVRCCIDAGVPALTVFAFSSENWRRPAPEVRLLLELFKTVLDSEARRLHKNGIRLRVIGDRAQFPEKLVGAISSAEEMTAGNDRLLLNVAANYGGRWDIVRAAQDLAAAVQAGQVAPADIDEAMLEQRLCLSDLSAPDLFIRSGGEKRVSNFLLWQMAYTEMHFTDCLWPDFDQGEFDAAMESYRQRQRRFGKTGDQVATASRKAV